MKPFLLAPLADPAFVADLAAQPGVVRSKFIFETVKTWILLAVAVTWCGVTAAQDVVVVGGTPGGIAAAVSAARLGHSVVLVEYHPHIGGMTASGLGASDIEHRALIQGFFREFVDRIQAHYTSTYGAGSAEVKACKGGYWYEPSVAEKVFTSFIAEQPSITLLTDHTLESAETDHGRVVAVTVKDRLTNEKRVLRAKVFVDATYEGDLVAAAGAEFRLGRESREEFGEPHAGVIYNVPGGERLGGSGAADQRLPAFTFRIPLSSNPANQVPLEAPPAGYDRTRYLGYFDDLRRGRLGNNLTTITLTIRELPNEKVELNMKPVALGFVFAEENVGYIEGDEAARERITARIRDLSLGLLWFLQHDPEVPENAHATALRYQPCRDEFADNGHFPFQLYVREGRRLVGEFTLSEKNITAQPGLASERFHADAIAVGEFPIDCFPTRKRQPGDDIVLEGYLGMLGKITRPYQIPYRIMIPKTIDGLIVPVPASTTHVAFSSIRLEPTWMAMGQAAGIAAHLAMQHDCALRHVPIEELQTALRAQHAVFEVPSEQPGAIPRGDARGKTASPSPDSKNPTTPTPR